MVVLVTGATGFIGSHLVDRLLAYGHQVTVLVRQSSDRKWLVNKPIRQVVGDLHNKEALKDGVESVEWVFHCAGVIGEQNETRFNRVNAEGTFNLMQAIAEGAPNIKKVVYISSLEAGGPSLDGAPRRETSPDAPITAYGHSKLKGEKFVLAYQDRIPVISIRPPAVYGPRDQGIYAFFQMQKYRFRLNIGFQPRYVSMVYIENLLDAILLCASANPPSGSIYYVDDQIPAQSWLTIQDWIAQGIGSPPKFTLYVPTSLFYSACGIGEVLQKLSKKTMLLNWTRYTTLTQPAWSCSSQTIQDHLGFRVKYSPQAALKKTAEWYLENGWL